MELILRFTRLDRDAPFDAPVPVTVHFAGSDSETADFRNPLADADLTDLRWYIERYPLWPVGPDYDRAEALQARLPRLGRALFDAVFDRSATAMRLWERFDGRRDGAEPDWGGRTGRLCAAGAAAGDWLSRAIPEHPPLPDRRTPAWCRRRPT